MDSINKLADAPNVRPTHQAIMTLHSEQQANRKYMIGGLFLIMAFSAATFGLTLGAAEFSKESTVSNTGVLMSKASHSYVKTAELEKVLMPIVGTEEIKTLADIHNVVISTTDSHHKITQRMETVQKIEKPEADKVVITTTEGTYTTPSEEFTTQLWYSTTEDKIPEEEVTEGGDKRRIPNLGKVIRDLKNPELTGNIDFGIGEYNIFDTCGNWRRNLDGRDTHECCVANGARNSMPTRAMGVCTYVCQYTGLGVYHWYKTQAEECSSGCCEETCGSYSTTCEAECVPRESNGSGSGSGSGDKQCVSKWMMKKLF